MCSLTDIFTNIVHIGRDKLPMSRQAIYVRQQSGHAQFEFTDDRFSRDADYNATQQYILDITVYLPHYKSEMQVNGANIQNIQVVKNRSFMRNKGHVFGVRTFTDSKNTLYGTCPEIYGT